VERRRAAAINTREFLPWPMDPADLPLNRYAEHRTLFLP
jgi:hypothetical protein